MNNSDSWNETYSSKYIPYEICEAPSIFINMNNAVNNPLQLTNSIIKKNRNVALINGRASKSNNKWCDIYGDDKPTYLKTCPVPTINVNTTSSGGGIGSSDNIITSGTITCSSLTSVDKSIPNNNGIILNGNGNIEMGGYISSGVKSNTKPSIKQQGYCETTILLDTTKYVFFNGVLDTIEYDSNFRYNGNFILNSMLNYPTLHNITPSSNGCVYAYTSNALQENVPIRIQSNGTYHIQCSLSIQQLSGSIIPPPTIEFIIACYLFNENPSLSRLIQLSTTPSRMTLSSYTNGSTTYYNYSSATNFASLWSSEMDSFIGGNIVAYIYKFNEITQEITTLPLPPIDPNLPDPFPPSFVAPEIYPTPNFIPNDGSGLSVNIIPSFIINKTT